MYISPRYSVSNWKILNFSTPSDWRTAVRVLEDRLNAAMRVTKPEGEFLFLQDNPAPYDSGQACEFAPRRVPAAYLRSAFRAFFRVSGLT
jgi:hypothetical protein